MPETPIGNSPIGRFRGYRTLHPYLRRHWIGIRTGFFTLPPASLSGGTTELFWRSRRALGAPTPRPGSAPRFCRGERWGTLRGRRLQACPTAPAGGPPPTSVGGHAAYAPSAAAARALRRRTRRRPHRELSSSGGRMASQVRAQPRGRASYLLLLMSPRGGARSYALRQAAADGLRELAGDRARPESPSREVRRLPPKARVACGRRAST